MVIFCLLVDLEQACPVVGSCKLVFDNSHIIFVIDGRLGMVIGDFLNLSYRFVQTFFTGIPRSGIFFKIVALVHSYNPSFHSRGFAQVLLGLVCEMLFLRKLIFGKIFRALMIP